MEHVTGDVPGLWQDEEGDRCGDLVGGAHPALGDGRDRGGAHGVAEEVVISVSMKPGATALTVMSRLATSRASDLVNPIRPALAAE